MKRAILALSVMSTIINISCEQFGESTVGSASDTPIYTASFALDTTYVSGSSLYATGKVTNTGSATINPPWYVEAQFYTDETYSIKLGGNYTTINVPLSRGQTTFWTISFRSSNVDVRNYPDFRVRDIRAIYK